MNKEQNLANKLKNMGITDPTAMVANYAKKHPSKIGTAKPDSKEPPRKRQSRINAEISMLIQ